MSKSVEFTTIEGFNPSLYDTKDVLIDPDTIIDENKHVNVEFSYPLTGDFTFTLHTNNDKGFTKGEFVKAVHLKYVEIYKEEEETTSIKPGPYSENLPANRNKTNGRYGIWGHGLCDLCLESADRDNEGVWHIHVGS